MEQTAHDRQATLSHENQREDRATPRWKPYVTEAKYEIVKQIRLPAYLFPALGFPILFYLFFGIVMPGKRDTVAAATYLLATFGAYGVIGIALFGIGIGLASERGQGWLTAKRASPMPISAYLFAKYCVAALLATTVMTLMFAVAAGLGHVRLGRTSGSACSRPRYSAAYSVLRARSDNRLSRGTQLCRGHHQRDILADGVSFRAAICR